MLSRLESKRLPESSGRHVHFAGALAVVVAALSVGSGRFALGGAETPSERGQRLAEEGKWSEAAAAFQQAVDQDADDAESWSRLAISRIGADDRPGYRRACTSMLARFTGTTSPRTATLVAYTCVAQADAVADLAAVVRVAERAVPLYKGNERVLGAALYRAGRYAEALDRLEAANRLSPPVGWDWLFTAMAHHRLGHAELAKENLERARRWVAIADQPKPRRGEAPRTTWYNWSERIEMTRSLLPEAEALLKTRASGQQGP